MYAVGTIIKSRLDHLLPATWEQREIDGDSTTDKKVHRGQQLVVDAVHLVDQLPIYTCRFYGAQDGRGDYAEHEITKGFIITCGTNVVVNGDHKPKELPEPLTELSARLATWKLDGSKLQSVAISHGWMKYTGNFLRLHAPFHIETNDMAVVQTIIDGIQANRHVKFDPVHKFLVAKVSGSDGCDGEWRNYNGQFEQMSNTEPQTRTGRCVTWDFMQKLANAGHVSVHHYLTKDGAVAA